VHRDRIAGFDAAVAGLDGQIAGKVTRWQREAVLLTSVPRFGDVVAQAWLGDPKLEANTSDCYRSQVRADPARAAYPLRPDLPHPLPLG